jgi:hypothetical protein
LYDYHHITVKIVTGSTATQASVAKEKINAAFLTDLSAI